jgi:hypothetical protein
VQSPPAVNPPVPAIATTPRYRHCRQIPVQSEGLIAGLRCPEHGAAPTVHLALGPDATVVPTTAAPGSMNWSPLL